MPAPRRAPYRASTPIEDRAGPDGLDLTRTRVRDDAATGKLVGAGLPVRRVTVDQSGESSPLIEWDRAPDQAQREQAEQLLGFERVQHAWKVLSPIATRLRASSRRACPCAPSRIIRGTTKAD